jgi:hypothetical protein
MAFSHPVHTRKNILISAGRGGFCPGSLQSENVRKRNLSLRVGADNQGAAASSVPVLIPLSDSECSQFPCPLSGALQRKCVAGRSTPSVPVEPAAAALRCAQSFTCWVPAASHHCVSRSIGSAPRKFPYHLARPLPPSVQGVQQACNAWGGG